MDCVDCPSSSWAYWCLCPVIGRENGYIYHRDRSGFRRQCSRVGCHLGDWGGSFCFVHIVERQRLELCRSDRIVPHGKRKREINGKEGEQRKIMYDLFLINRMGGGRVWEAFSLSALFVGYGHDLPIICLRRSSGVAAATSLYDIMQWKCGQGRWLQNSPRP